jgi:integrase
MNIVQPIRDKKQIEAMKTYLRKKSERNYMYFLVGINSAFRVSDLRTLKVKDVKGKDHFYIRTKKKDKTHRLLISPKLKAELTEYIRGMGDDDYLFQSGKGQNEPLSRQQDWRILQEAAKHVGIKEVGCHTTRKTFGYWHYQKYRDIAVLQSLLGHDDPSDTYKYIGITEDLKDASMKDFYL